MKRPSILYFLIFLIGFSVYFLLQKTAYQDNISQSFKRIHKKYQELSIPHINAIIATPKATLKEKLSKIFEHNSFADGKEIPSDAAVIVAALYGDASLFPTIAALKDFIDCHSTELPQCEYYCSTGFAEVLYKVRFQHQPPPQQSCMLMDDNLQLTTHQLADQSEEELCQMLEDEWKNLEQTQLIFKNIPLKFTAIVWMLKEKGRLERSLQILLKYCLWLYGRDASGDSVNLVQGAIADIAFRRLKED